MINVSIIVLTINIVICLLSLLFILRNNYTYKVRLKAINLISDYCDILIEKGKYDPTVHYYEKYAIGYNEYLFKFWLFGVKNVIKEEYRDLILSYKE